MDFWPAYWLFLFSPCVCRIKKHFCWFWCHLWYMLQGKLLTPAEQIWVCHLWMWTLWYNSFSFPVSIKFENKTHHDDIWITGWPWILASVQQCIHYSSPHYDQTPGQILNILDCIRGFCLQWESYMGRYSRVAGTHDRNPCPYFIRQEAKYKHEVGWSYETLKPTPTNSFPPARFHLIKVLQISPNSSSIWRPSV